jgi:hypothetical protein
VNGTVTTTSTTIEVAREASISYRMLDYLVRTGIVTPTIEARGPGTQRRWTEEDVALVLVVARIMRAVGPGWRPIVEQAIEQLHPLPLTWWPEVLVLDVTEDATLTVKCRAAV